MDQMASGPISKGRSSRSPNSILTDSFSVKTATVTPSFRSPQRPCTGSKSFKPTDLSASHKRTVSITVSILDTALKRLLIIKLIVQALLATARFHTLDHTRNHSHLQRRTYMVMIYLDGLPIGDHPKIIDCCSPF